MDPGLVSYLNQPKYFGRRGSVVRAEDIVRAANQAHVDPRLFSSIVANESGWGAHPRAVRANNFSGLMGAGKQLFRYPTPQAGLLAAAQNLQKNYISKGLTTPQQIGPVYAPTRGATNDPNGINKGWIGTVNGIMGNLPGGAAPAPTPPPSPPVASPPLQSPAGPQLVHGNPNGPGTVVPAPVEPPKPQYVGGFTPMEPTLVKQQSILATLKLAGYAEDHEQACKDTDTAPSEKQIEAGNYAKGTLTVRGLHIAIENPKGSVRKGTDKNGKEWEITMAWSYGYIKHVKGNRQNAEAIDGDKLDVFLGPHPETGPIFVVDQVIDGKYDEPKIMLGFDNEECAKQGYLANYSPGWKGIGAITKMTDAQFHKWVDGGQTEPAAKSLRKEADWTGLAKALTLAGLS